MYSSSCIRRVQLLGSSTIHHYFLARLGRINPGQEPAGRSVIERVGDYLLIVGPREGGWDQNAASPSGTLGLRPSTSRRNKRVRAHYRFCAVSGRTGSGDGVPGVLCIGADQTLGRRDVPACLLTTQLPYSSLPTMLALHESSACQVVASRTSR